MKESNQERATNFSNKCNYTTEIPVDYHQSRQQVPNKAECVGSEHRWQRPPKHETLLQRPWGQLRILPGPWCPCALTPVFLQRQKNDLRPRIEINLWSHETWKKAFTGQKVTAALPSASDPAARAVSPWPRLGLWFYYRHLCSVTCLPSRLFLQPHEQKLAWRRPQLTPAE